MAMAGADQDERRQFSRVAFHRPAELTISGTESTVAVLDLSLRGALLEVAAGFVAEAGARCRLVVHLDPGETAIRLEGQVAHRSGTRLGLRCTSIDLESIGHLRRLVELNLGDEELLHRELSALIGSPGSVP